MTAGAAWERYWRYLTARFRREVDDELEFHLAMRTRDLVAQGKSATEAAAEARRRFGDRERVRATLHQIEERRGHRLRLAFLLHEWRQDVRYGIRTLVKRPGFAAMTAGSLAIGIATVTVVMSVIDAYLVRPLPVRDPQELVVIGASTRASGGMAAGMLGRPMVRELSTRTDLFTDVAAHTIAVAAAQRSEAGLAERGSFLAVTGTYFSMLGVPTSLGRPLLPADEEGRERVLVLGHGAWQRLFAGDSSVIGTTLRLNTLPFVIVGIAPPWFHGTEAIIDPLGYLPSSVLATLELGAVDAEARWGNGRFTVTARRRAGRSLADIRQALEVVAADVARAHPDVGEDFHLPVFAETRARPTLSAAGSMGAVATIFGLLALLVLVTASANATNLILARGSTRATELAVRQALGASRARITRQLLVEVLLLSLVALAGALVLARLAISALKSIPFTFDDLAMNVTIQLDTRVFAIALGVALLVGVVAGLSPSLATSRLAVYHRLRDGGRGGTSRRGGRTRAILVTAQVAASVVVLACAGLFITSARQGRHVDLGFRPGQLLTLGVDASLAHYEVGEARLALARTMDEVEQIPGVRSAAWASTIPIQKGASGMTEAHGSEATPVGVFTAEVGPGYFDVLEIPVLEGRGFLPTDDSTRGGVVVINARAAELLWPGGSALGRTMRLDPDGPPLEVVGVVKDSRYLLLGEAPRPYLYRALAQHYAPSVYLHVRTAGDAAALIGAVRAAVARAGTKLTPFSVRTMDDALTASPNGTLLLRVGAGFAAVVGGLAAVLTLLGVYGVIVMSVVQRTREIGLRMALGASRATVVRGVLAGAAKVAITGIAVGVVLSVLAGRLLGGLLVGSRSADGWIVVGVALGVGGAALCSAYLPARRAARIDPVAALAEG